MTDMKPEELDQLSHFASHLHYADLPPQVQAHTGWVLADTLASIVAGSAEPEMQRLNAAMGFGSGATLIGAGRQVHAEAAALLNGTAGTFLEMDEGNRFSRGHPAIHVLPAALALSEMQGVDAERFLSALVVGYEVGSRIGAASQLRGAMHPHGTWGTIGAAAACARVLGSAPSSMKETINVSSSMTTATSKRTMLEGGLVRNVYAGLSNRNGVLASQLVACGFTGERDGLSSLFGEIISEKFDVIILLRDLGSDWHLMHNYFKLHSCCRYNHGTLDALDTMAAQNPLPAADRIARIQVTTYHLAAELNDPAPRNTLAAKFSVPFAVATRIVHQSSALSSFTWEAVRDPRVLALAQKVDVSEDPDMSRRLPNERPARVVITDIDGRQWTGEAGVNRGDDASPYSEEELTHKFLDLTGRVWTEDHAKQVLHATHQLCTGKLNLAHWLDLVKAPPKR
jgi:2-methylcitrate dehydratase PrpD